MKKMSRVLTFSRVFPSYHPKAGQPTHFVGKIWESIYMEYPEWLGDNCSDVKNLYPQIGLHGILEPKHHTIRAGNRWKVGDKFSPRVWSGKPYKSKQIIIAPDIEVKKCFDFEFSYLTPNIVMATINNNIVSIEEVAINDGLSEIDFINWFNKPFIGQVICWNENIGY